MQSLRLEALELTECPERCLFVRPDGVETCGKPDEQREEEYESQCLTVAGLSDDLFDLLHSAADGSVTDPVFLGDYTISRILSGATF